MSGTPTVKPKHRMFPGHADQIAHARDFVRRVLDSCPVLDEAVLLVSELATNAVKHTATGKAGNFHVTIHQRETQLLIAIKDDGSEKEPTAYAVDALAEEGRGLSLVELIARRWGHCGGEHGRTVWFELNWKNDPCGGNQMSLYGSTNSAICQAPDPRARRARERSAALVAAAGSVSVPGRKAVHALMR